MMARVVDFAHLGCPQGMMGIADVHHLTGYGEACADGHRRSHVLLATDAHGKFFAAQCLPGNQSEYASLTQSHLYKAVSAHMRPRNPVPSLLCAHGLIGGCAYPAQFNAFIAVDRQLNEDQALSLQPTYEPAFVAPLVPVQVRERTTTTNRAKAFNALHEIHRRPIEGRIRSLFMTFRILAEPRATYNALDMAQYNRLLEALVMVWNIDRPSQLWPVHNPAIPHQVLSQQGVRADASLHTAYCGVTIPGHRNQIVRHIAPVVDMRRLCYGGEAVIQQDGTVRITSSDVE